jgi:hypothetical protein
LPPIESEIQPQLILAAKDLPFNQHSHHAEKHHSDLIQSQPQPESGRRLQSEISWSV